MTGPGNPFALQRWRGSAATFHGRAVEDPAAPAVWAFDVARPAVVLGSRQGEGELDAAAVRAAGVDVVHRRSGGGVVLLVPGEVVWVDVVVPAGHPAWVADVAASMVWLGERWVAALGDLGVGATVHPGPMTTTDLARQICFAGLGPGEVLADGVKLVGISQRRTRAAARFQCAVHVRWDPAATVDLLAAPRPAPGDLPPVATVPAAVAAALPEALAAVLP